VRQRDQLVDVGHDLGVADDHHAPTGAGRGVELVGFEGDRAPGCGGGELPATAGPEDHVLAVEGEVHRVHRRVVAVGEHHPPDRHLPEQVEAFGTAQLRELRPHGHRRSPPVPRQ
jgi:hypothetical protein